MTPKLNRDSFISGYIQCKFDQISGCPGTTLEEAKTKFSRLFSPQSYHAPDKLLNDSREEAETAWGKRQ